MKFSSLVPNFQPLQGFHRAFQLEQKNLVYVKYKTKKKTYFLIDFTPAKCKVNYCRLKLIIDQDIAAMKIAMLELQFFFDNG